MPKKLDRIPTLQSIGAMSTATTFTHAIPRKPAKSVENGLRAEDQGNPSADVFSRHHQLYLEALRETGADVTVLPALKKFPDSVFVEDSALCLPQGAIAMRPGAPSRLGEAAAMKTTLQTLYDEVRIVEDGFIEGGDILVTEREILVGLSARTDKAGVASLRALTSDWGWTVRELQTPPDVLHFKTDCGLLDAETILSTDRLAANGCFDGYRVLRVAEGEEACANCVRFNDVVLFPEGFPKTAALLREEGYTLVELPNDQAAKIDGGMSCLSLRFSPPT